MKRTIRILRLYPDLLDLYGDGGNLLALRRRLEQMGHAVQCDSLELSQKKDFSAYDLIAVGAGKTRNLCAAMREFASFAPALQAAVEQGRVVLATGTGMLLLGQGLRVGGEVVPGAGLFHYEGAETGQVSVSDCIVRMQGLNAPLYGFVNQTVTIHYAARPNLFEVLSGKAGQDGAEGMVRGNCFATSLLGPLLAKNPDFCHMLLERLLGEDMGEYDDALAREAYRRTLAEFPVQDGAGLPG